MLVGELLLKFHLMLGTRIQTDTLKDLCKWIKGFVAMVSQRAVEERQQRCVLLRREGCMSSTHCAAYKKMLY